MNKKEKRLYEMPVLTVVSFRTERGYAVSGLQKIWVGSEDDETTGVSDYTEENEGSFLNW